MGSGWRGIIEADCKRKGDIFQRGKGGFCLCGMVEKRIV
jgi:hypothetical protein